MCPGSGHAERLLPLISILARRNIAVHVMTRPEVRGHVEAASGLFADLFAAYPIDAVDHESIPMPSRFVTFAAAYAEAITAEVAALRPQLIVYDSFMVVGPLVAQRLGVPYVGMRAGHAQVPADAIAKIRLDPRVSTSSACLDAVERLAREHGMRDASPFAYLDGMSPFLNLYPEPAEYLHEDERRAFEPVAFFGSLAPDLREQRSTSRPLQRDDAVLRVYISFGTAIWRYYGDIATAALTTLCDVFARRRADVLVSLGGHRVSDHDLQRLRRPGVRVETYVDQWGALKDADLFVTHNGLNSTHEAVFHQVPMLSYPFFGDQPAMAHRCQDLGLAMKASAAPLERLASGDVEHRIDAMLSARDAYATRLAAARVWELNVIASRESVVDRMLAL